MGDVGAEGATAPGAIFGAARPRKELSLIRSWARVGAVVCKWARM